MSWFKVDDAFHSSKPVLKIPRKYRLAAIGLWASAGTWCAQEESDGFFPEWVLEELCGTAAIARHLIAAGLWTEVRSDLDGSSSVSGESGWQFKNWSKYQPTREDLDEKREKDRVRQANYRMSQRDKGVTTVGLTEGQHHESAPPDPTRPDPTTKEEAKASSPPRNRGTRIPNDFSVAPAMVAWARANCPDVDGQRETLKFINYYQGISGAKGVKLDWVATWRNWMLNAAERAPAGKSSVGDKMRSTIQNAQALQARADQGKNNQLQMGA